MNPQPDPADISLCSGCSCMTYTLADSTCGKCGAVKGQAEPDELRDILLQFVESESGVSGRREIISAIEAEIKLNQEGHHD